MLLEPEEELRGVLSEVSMVVRAETDRVVQGPSDAVVAPPMNVSTVKPWISPSERLPAVFTGPSSFSSNTVGEVRVTGFPL